MPEDVPAGTDSEPLEGRSDVEHLQDRIAALEETSSPDSSTGGRELHLVFSLGFVVITTLGMGAYGGKWLAHRFDWPGLEVGVLMLSVCLAAFSVYKLLRPFLGK